MRTKLILMAIASLLLACKNNTEMSPVPHYDAATLAMKYDAVYALDQDLSCTDSSVCSTIGIGSKPCGGPAKWLVFSMTTADLQELLRAVADLNDYEAGYNVQEHRISECNLTPAPQVGCVAQRCVDLSMAP